MADFATIRTKIVDKVKAQTTYFGTNGEAVYDYEPEVETVVKDPWALVVPSGNENDYVTTAENRRTYGFVVRVFVDRGRGRSAAETLLTSIVSALVDAFDQDFTLGGSVLLLTAAPSAWGYLPGEKEYRTAEIRLAAKTDFDVTA